jgi:hypothetical protein
MPNDRPARERMHRRLPFAWGVALAAGLMGLDLGGLRWWSANRLVPVIVHEIRDFIALIEVLRRPPTTVRRDA